MKNKFSLKYLITGIVIICILLFVINFFGFFDSIKMKKALEEKYHEKFVVKDLKVNFNLFSRYKSAVAYSKNYPNLIFYVDYEKGSIGDSYVTRRVGYKLSNEISENLKKYVNSDFYVFSKTMLQFTSVKNPDISVEEYLKIDNMEKMDIDILFDKEDLTVEKLANAVNHSLDNLAKFNGSLTIYVTDLKLLKEAKNYLETHDQPYGEFTRMTDSYSLKTYSVNNSIVYTSSYEIDKLLKEKNINL